MEQEAAETSEDAPARRGSREERREATLRAIAADGVGHCAYCGRRLPPLPSRGGRPTPYCPADPGRYGQWGAKVISCAMLDENREIWVQVYGPDQSMTHVDVQVVDDRAATLLAALEPVRDELTSLRTRIADETLSALSDKAAADTARDQALVLADQATAKRDQASAEAEQARLQAEDDRAGLLAARQEARAAVKERDQAAAARQSARQAKDIAEADRQRALDQVAAAQDRVTALQNTLAGERAEAVERLDRLRQDADRQQQQLRASLTEDWEHRLRTRTDEFADQLHGAREAADQRIADLSGQLTAATRQYADALAPLHEQLAGLRTELAERAAAATELQQRHDALADTVRQMREQALEEQ
ncbi:hypothetical protein [Amycolatopsis saalfeldensis]|uniref:Chromosome segregation ATPase n=1 Tax=Amycolatopsis saalfeldensis TaxID=394193 RepID=A0A1H8SXR8_9PSEU|nr:hypothetical protein [Amycolatopsis saalfeldensis]SEO83138.1 hypothetical protein SAMN04489732_102320 [Amycolatopsis saalfeldensis]